jgi:hypothetical protein
MLQMWLDLIYMFMISSATILYIFSYIHEAIYKNNKPSLWGFIVVVKSIQHLAKLKVTYYS